MNAHDTDDTVPDNLDAAHEEIRRLRRQLHNERVRACRHGKNERCFRELAEHIREVFWMTNPLGDQLVYISPAYEHIWGQTCDSLYHDPGTRLAWIHEADRERVLTAFKRDAAVGRFDETYRIERPDGQTRWIHDRAFAVHDDHGEIYRLAGFALDITDHVDTLDRVNNLHNRLACHERLNVFALLGTGLAHDLAQPLTAARNFIAHVRSFAHGIREGEADILGKADREIERAVRIIRHLRDFAQQGKASRERQTLFPIIHEVKELFDSDMRAGAIRFITPTQAELAGLELPLDRIFAQQILRNLVANAIEAFHEVDGDEPRQIAISIDTTLRDHVDIEVSDNGGGIADDVGLFEPFLTTKHEGLGLGLALSRALARCHDGDLFRADRSDTDARTRFVLRLPREIPEPD